METYQQPNRHQNTDKVQFTHMLDNYIRDLSSYHDNLLRSYNQYSLEQQENYFYRIGNQFDAMIEDQGNRYYSWITKSKEAKRLVKVAANKAHAVALYFEKVHDKGYRKTTCKRMISSLIKAIKNAKRQNARR